MAKKKSDSAEIVNTAQTYEHFIGKTEQTSLGDFYEDEWEEEDLDAGPKSWEVALIENSKDKQRYAKELIVHIKDEECLQKFAIALGMQLTKKTNSVVYKPLSEKSIFDVLVEE